MRGLHLNRERLTELLPGDLAGLAGGAPPTERCVASYGEPLCLPRTLQRACLLTGVYPTDGCA